MDAGSARKRDADRAALAMVSSGVAMVRGELVDGEVDDEA